MLNEVEYIYSNPDSKRLNNKENLIPFINYEKPAPERCLDMLLAKYRGESYQSEVMMLTPERSPIPRLRCKLEEARILLITDGGLVQGIGHGRGAVGKIFFSGIAYPLNGRIILG